jgi:hypothetical protein
MPDEPHDDLTVTGSSKQDVSVTDDELPVVARLIVEVRSDGRRTVARGAMEDAATGTKAAIEASGSTPLELALGLAKTLLSAPWLRQGLARSTIRALLKK